MLGYKRTSFSAAGAAIMVWGAAVFIRRQIDNVYGHIDYGEYHQPIGALIFVIGVWLFISSLKKEH